MKMFEITAPRLRVRPWQETEADWQGFARWARDPQMVRYIVNNSEPFSDDKIDDFFARQQRNLEASGVCIGAVEELESGELVGIGGLAALELVDDFQLAWWIDPSRQGAGYATELARALISHGCEKLGLVRVLAVIHPENTASRRVAEKAGMKILECVPGNTLERRWGPEDVLVYVAKSPKSGLT